MTSDESRPTSQKSLSNKITDDQIDTWYRLGIQNGALGGKIIGAGGGGFLLFYCESLKKNLREILTKQGLVEIVQASSANSVADLCSRL